MDTKTAEFMKKFYNVLHGAVNRVNEQAKLGENDFVSLPDMFPHGSQDAAFMVYTKACRALGYLEAKNLKKAKEEFLDIINYSAFSYVLVEKEINDAAGCRLPRANVTPPESTFTGSGVLSGEESR